MSGIQPGDLRLRPPIPGESLDGFVAEITGENDLVKVRTISAAGGVTHAHRPGLTTSGGKDLPALAAILETDVEELRSRAYPFVGEDQSRRAFFGTTVHKSDLLKRERRYSPAALATSSHHRAMWQLRLPFDTETGEFLVSRCTRPGCLKVQRWRHSVGVRYCDSCVMDLSLQVVPGIAGYLLDAYNLAAGLTHTDPTIRSASLALLPGEIRALGADMAFELLIRLIPVLDPACTWRNGSRIWVNDPFDIARGMSAAWAVLLDWPQALIGKITRDLAVSTTRFNDGNRGRTSAFFQLRSSPFTPTPVAAAISALHGSIDQDGPASESVRRVAVGCKEAAGIMGFSTSELVPLRRRGVFRTVAVMSGPRFVAAFDRGEIVTVARDIRQRWNLCRAGNELGLPFYAVEQLCALGRIERMTHPFFVTRYGEPQVTEAAVDEFRDLLLRCGTANLAGAVPILSAVRMVGGRLKPWDAIVEAMLDGTLPFRIQPGKSRMFERILVREADLAVPAAQPITRPGTPTALTIRMEMGFPFAEKTTKRDAGEVLNLNVKQYTDLLSGYTRSTDRVVPIIDIVRIAENHISCTEIAERLGVSYQSARARAAALGCARVSSAGFQRDMVEAALLSDT